MARIAPYLPRKRDDPVVISAIVYRNWSGESLRHIATWYGVTVGRVQTWETQLRDGGQLAAIMKALGLPHAPALQWSNGGQVSAWRNPDMAKRIAALRFSQFREALRAATGRADLTVTPSRRDPPTPAGLHPVIGRRL